MCDTNRAVCPACKVKMRTHHMGEIVIEMYLSPPQPYALWHCDLKECPGCKFQVLNGFAIRPYLAVHQEGFDEEIKRLEDTPSEIVIKEYERLPE